MALRKPPVDLDPGKLQLTGAATDIRWQDYSCTLVTPLYGGGVKAGEVDAYMPIRASAIRGHLRFWWRLLAKHKYRLKPDEIRQREFALWGGLGDTPQASNVWVRIDTIANLVVEPWAEYEKSDRGGWKSIPKPAQWANAPYALFPAQGKRPGPGSENPHGLAIPGLTWTLHLGLHYPDKADATLREDLDGRVHEALRWWASFGGVGARSRRGLGAFQIQNLECVSADEAEVASCRLVVTNSSKDNASAAWEASINKLKDFRQKPGFARNTGTKSGRPGRSRWPEPDAIRRATNTHAPLHAPEHQAGQAYPRAAFGLPIIFQFKDEDKKAGDPQNFTLGPEGFDRLGSPLLLRPYFKNGKWFPAALLLPHEHVKKMRLVMPDRTIAAPQQWWRPEQAAQVEPMAPHGQDALSAFLKYFAK